ncbi:MAG: RecX family transcriptional regulator [Bacteroidia bacterium]|nr:RecX family transcriptional regulator [Bacteroidia bacterium]
MKEPAKDTTILKKLYAYCAYQDRCRKEIEEKMKEWELPEEEWESWMAHLEAERFWDEARFVKSFVRGKFFHKQWGPLKIRQELRQRDIPEQMISATLAREIPHEEFTQTLEKLIDKKWREYRETNRDKLIRFLLQKGYKWDEFGKMLPQEHKEDL